MAYVNNGTERSLKVSVYKKVGGNYVQGYPKVYDGQNSWGNPSYPTLTDIQARQLSDAEFSDRLLAFKMYVESIESGADFDTDIVGDGAIRSNEGVCLPTTTTTAQPVWSFSVRYSASPVETCIGGVSDTAYSSKQFPGVGDFIYADSSLSIPWAKGPAVLLTNPSIYGNKITFVAVVDTVEYDVGEIIAVNFYDCDTIGTTTIPVTTTTTTEITIPGMYFQMYRCNGETCYLPKSVKDAYEFIHGAIQTGDRFYGAIEGNPDYLYTYTGVSYVSAITPDCVVNGITKTTDTCP